MAKRKRIADVEKLIKEGRGTGRGLEYKPWIRIQDVPSLGRSTRLKGIKTGRQHEFLSDMERNYFYFLEYSDSVVDIREQYPLLPLEETILIAQELGISHPKHPKTGEYVVMTTDFLVTADIGGKRVDFARTIKAKDDLLNRRIIEKFYIEQVYWKNKNIDWGIVTDNEIDKVIAHNISFMHSYNDIKNLDCFYQIKTMELQDLIYEFLRRIIENKSTIREVCSQFDNDLNLEFGSGLSIFKYLVINKIINVDITQKINVDRVIPVAVNEECIKKVEAL